MPMRDDPEPEVLRACGCPVNSQTCICCACPVCGEYIVTAKGSTPCSCYCKYQGHEAGCTGSVTDTYPQGPTGPENPQQQKV